MNNADAYRILGFSRSVDFKSIEQAYQKKSRDLQRKIVPGNPLSVRQQAQKDLAQLASAWNTLKTAAPKKQKRTTPAKWSATNRRPHGLADRWEAFFSLLPFSRVTIAMVTVLLLCTGLFFIHHFLKGL